MIKKKNFLLKNIQEIRFCAQKNIFKVEKSISKFSSWILIFRMSITKLKYLILLPLKDKWFLIAQLESTKPELQNRHIRIKNPKSVEVLNVLNSTKNYYFMQSDIFYCTKNVRKKSWTLIWSDQIFQDHLKFGFLRIRWFQIRISD